MARNRFVAEVLTPEGEVFNEEIEMLSTVTTVGSIGLLANHEPLLARLDPARWRFSVHAAPAGNRDIDAWRSELGASFRSASTPPPERSSRPRTAARSRRARRATAGAPRPSWRSPGADRGRAGHARLRQTSRSLSFP